MVVCCGTAVAYYYTHFVFYSYLLVELCLSFLPLIIMPLLGVNYGINGLGSGAGLLLSGRMSHCGSGAFRALAGRLAGNRSY